MHKKWLQIMAVDICYIISHGFASRMLLQTNLIGKLADRGVSLAIISQDSQDEELKSISRIENIQCQTWHSRNTIWDDNYMHKRMYYLEDINKNTALKEKFYNGILYSKSKHPWKRIRPLYYLLIFHLIKLFPSIRAKFLQSEERYLHSKEAIEILKKLQPKMVVSTYPVSIMEAKILHAARQLKISTVLHLLSWDNISCKGRFPVLTDNFIAWGDVMEGELMDYYGVSKNQIAKCGVPHFDQHIEARKTRSYPKILHELGLNPEGPYIFFAMSSPRFTPREIEIVEWVATAVRNNTFGAEMQLVVRPHPQNMTSFMADHSWIGRLKRLNGDRVAIDFPQLVKSKVRWSMKHSDMVHLSALLSGCALCLNSGSTVTIDALMHHKPVVLTSFDGHVNLPYWNSARRLIDYTHLKKILAKGGVESVSSYKALEWAICEYVKDPSKNERLRKKTLHAYCLNDDGFSTERVVEVLTKKLNQVA